MTSDRLYLDYLRDILENAEKASKFIEGMTKTDLRKSLAADV